MSQLTVYTINMKRPQNGHTHTHWLFTQQKKNTNKKRLKKIISGPMESQESAPVHLSFASETLWSLPSVSFHVRLPLSSTRNIDGLLHICKWITLFVKICEWVCVEKCGKGCKREKGAPAIALFFSSLYNPEEDKLWGTQRGSATDLLGSSTSQQCIPAGWWSDIWIGTEQTNFRHVRLMFVTALERSGPSPCKELN